VAGTFSDEQIRLVDSELAALGTIVPRETSDAWRRIAPLVPDWVYLSGGTALAVHLHHRVSRDLDFFTRHGFDAEALAAQLVDAFDDFAATHVEDGTVNGVLGGAKLQFLDATRQQMLREPERRAGLLVASLEDILATKVKVIGDRPALRDYFDLMAIEQATGLTVDEGFRGYVEKYEEGSANPSNIAHLLKCLGYLGDVDEDPGLPVDKTVVERYWHRRQPEIASALHLR
jgi:hypothetical protein